MQRSCVSRVVPPAIGGTEELLRGTHPYDYKKPK